MAWKLRVGKEAMAGEARHTVRTGRISCCSMRCARGHPGCGRRPRPAQRACQRTGAHKQAGESSDLQAGSVAHTTAKAATPDTHNTHNSRGATHTDIRTYGIHTDYARHKAVAHTAHTHTHTHRTCMQKPTWLGRMELNVLTTSPPKKSSTTPTTRAP